VQNTYCVLVLCQVIKLIVFFLWFNRRESRAQAMLGGLSGGGK